MSLVKVRADPWELVAPTRLLTRRDGFVVGQMGPRRQLDANDMPTTMAARQCLLLVVDMTRGHRQNNTSWPRHRGRLGRPASAAFSIPRLMRLRWISPKGWATHAELGTRDGDDAQPTSRHEANSRYHSRQTAAFTVGHTKPFRRRSAFPGRKT